MGTRIISAQNGMAEAVSRLRDGQLVAFPTETVYGLGANALDANAVARIFAAKGRPSTNPLIVHVPDIKAARALAREWSPVAETLATRFWPGPLTLVVPKAVGIAPGVTAGGETIGLRVPCHPVALQLLRESGLPLAAPSANRSEAISPTNAQHVADSLGAWVDDLLILDGGLCDVGLESTVLDLTGDVPRILRPGMVTLEMLRQTVGPVAVGGAEAEGGTRSPGQMRRHYAPQIPLLIVPGAQIDQMAREGDALLRLTGTPAEYANRLYHFLRQSEAAGSRRILVEEPPHDSSWDAIHDRLCRAAAAPEKANP